MSGGGGDDVVVIDRDDVSNYNPEQILPQSPEEIRKIRDWLEPTEYWLGTGEYRKHLASHVSGTGAWLTSSETYCEWLNSIEQGLLWIKGIPGSGKAPVLYFFFRQIIDANHGPTALLRDWLDQILQYSPPLQKRLKELREDRRTIDSMSMEDLWKLLRLALSGLPAKATCIADALDEMDQGNDQFIRSLAELGQWKPSQVKVLITSRPVPSVEAPLRNIKGFQMRLVEEKVDLDISSFVEHGLEHTSINTDDRALMKEAIPGRANGLFLYAKLAMDAFLKPGARTRDVIQSLPADLHELYTNLLHEHARRSGVPHDVQLLILQWVTHATRPLRLIELAEVLHTTHSVDQNRDFKTSKDLVRAAAGPLLEILADETVSVLHHSFTEYLKCVTRSEDAVGYSILRTEQTHSRLALACLKYLQEGCLDHIQAPIETSAYDWDLSLSIPSSSYISHDDREENRGERQAHLDFPFFPYAAANWHVHVLRSANAGHHQSEVDTSADTFLNNDHYFRAWLKVGWPKDDLDTTGATPLHIAAKLGLGHIIKNLISRGVTIDAADRHGRTPIWWAAASGQGSIITILVQSGFNPDIDDADGLKPLHVAAEKGHDKAVHALLAAGVDPLTRKTQEYRGLQCGNAPRSTGHAPLMYACKNGHLEAVEAFLPFLNDIEVVHQALIWSAEKGQCQLVKRILQHPQIDIDAGVRGKTALFAASSIPDRNTIRALIEANANAAVICHPEGDESGRQRWLSAKERNDTTRGDTALQTFCQSQSKSANPFSSARLGPDESYEIFSLLIQGGANIHQCTLEGDTILHTAVNDSVLVRMLLNAGADANAVNNEDLSPLHKIVSPDSLATLVEEGNADVNKVQKASGKTPLLSLLASGSYYRGHIAETIQKLLHYKPDLKAKNKGGEGPLHVALKNSRIEQPVIRALLDSGADVHEQNAAGNTPLLALDVSGESSGEILGLLIEAGANVNERDSQGETLLWRAIGYHRYVKSFILKLIEKGAEINVRNHVGRTLLHVAVASRDISNYNSKDDVRQHYLVKKGLNIHATDHHGNTLIHEWAKRNFSSHYSKAYTALGQELVTMGLSLDQHNHEGESALHILINVHFNFQQPGAHIELAPFDWIISNIKNIDQPDGQGNTALHLAVKNSDALTLRLVNASADLGLKNKEGLTPLHVAALFRRCNALTIILDAAKSHGQDLLDVKDGNLNTPLYYAVRSGRLESVKMLVDAGADITSNTLFAACADFEKESNSDVTNNGYCREASMGEKHTLRLEEIVQILMKNGKAAYDFLETRRWHGHFNLDNISKMGHEYTYTILLQARDELSRDSEGVPDNVPEAEDQDDDADDITLFLNRPLPPAPEKPFLEHEARCRKEAQLRAVQEYTGYVENDPNSELIIHLLKTRKYDSFRILFDKGVDFQAPHSSGIFKDCSTLDIFAQYGFTTLLDQIVPLVAQANSGKFEAGVFGTTPILFRAIDREIPNMDAVRLLVEKFHVDVNYINHVKSSHSSGNSSNTVLHHLAEGKYWWHTALAIPYLLFKGADSDLKDDQGRTPLHVALKNVSRSSHGKPFIREAAHALIDGGANVNILDSQDKSCLAYALDDETLIKALLERGAEVKVDALSATLEKSDPAMLRLLLAAGAGSSMVEGDSPLRTVAKKHGYLDNLHNSPPKEQRAANKRRQEQLFEMLLKSGADPYATFSESSTTYACDENALDYDDIPLLLHGTANKEELGNVTVLHDLLARGYLVHPILMTRDFDPNRRDQRGQTALHAACRSHHGINAPINAAHEEALEPSSLPAPSFLEHLLSRGADPLAVDKDGRNMLHYMFIGVHETKYTSPDAGAVTHLATTYPSLINQADRYGKTPFLLALRNTVLQDDTTAALALFNAGADPRAVDSDLNTALHILTFGICTYSKTANVAIRSLFTTLLDRGLDINARNARGETPIFNVQKPMRRHHPRSEEYLIYSGYWELGRFHKLEMFGSDVRGAISLFVSAGADFFATDNQGRGLLHHCARTSSYLLHHCARTSSYLFEVLLEKGLDPALEDKKKRTALDIAVVYNKQSILDLFGKDGKPKVKNESGNDGDDEGMKVEEEVKEEEDEDEDDYSNLSC
ncbi:unnamed protein product [Periconia digitata]|uniref:Nephrocystin 3-like N-terminal domain-containing protein n=1 Tax=Periconia digitata TaxID=1303443 RepID=A0A9W4UEU5_9PLEO|nr:unnamed protein product [Periconia digitata]